MYICCSWWPDSMFLTFLLLWYRHIVKWQDLSITNILHINHNTSQSDDLMQDLVYSLFWWVVTIKHLFLEKKEFTETELRKKRQDFYKFSLQENNSLQDVYLCLWHNLDDRIENSFLHFDRWTHIQGIVNMSMKQKKCLYENWGEFMYTCLRPLLWFKKKDISWWCDLLSIPYVIDSHNLDETQKRIQYRRKIEIISPSVQKIFYEERKYVYNKLGKGHESKVSLNKLVYPSFWKIGSLYVTTLPKSRTELVDLLVRIWIYFNMSSARLYEIMKWFLKREWSMYISWWWFLFWYGELFLAQQEIKSTFRENMSLPSPVLLSENKERYEIDVYTWNVSPNQQKCNGWSVVTFPQEGDKWWSKSFTKRAATQQIPFFRRRSLPIIKKNNKITDVLPLQNRPWIM